MLNGEKTLDMKKFIKLILALVVIILLVKLCSDRFGSVISLPGGLGEQSTEESGGGWFGQKDKTEKNETKAQDETISSDEIKELERELGIGTDRGSSTSTSSPSSTSSTTNPLSFKGIPLSGSLSAFGTELVKKAGFRNAGDGTYTGDFAGYSGCKVTPSGNPVQEVRVDFPVISDWDALEKAYDALQASLTQKYGIEPKTATNNNEAVYSLPNGTITLDADVANRSTWHVILTYANALSSSSGTLGRNPIDDL